MSEYDLYVRVQRQVAALVAEKTTLQAQVDAVVEERDLLRKQLDSWRTKLGQVQFLDGGPVEYDESLLSVSSGFLPESTALPACPECGVWLKTIAPGLFECPVCFAAEIASRQHSDT